MSNFKVGKSRFSRFINGKGFYIALALCLVAIGTAAYLAANSSFSGINNLTTTDSSSTGTTTYSGTAGWDDENAQQTGNNVSGVPAGSSSSEPTSSISTAATSSASSSANSASSSKSSSSKATSSSTAAPTLYVLPIEGSILVDYSGNTPVYDKTMADWRINDCVDISGAVGTPVKACADGTVLEIKTDDMLGQVVILQHGGGITSIYGNLTNQVPVKKGQTVEAGSVIGAVGNTAQGEIALAPHLHFAMMKNGQYVDPLLTMGKKSK